jgi:hypothetical protein
MTLQRQPSKASSTQALGSFGTFQKGLKQAVLLINHVVNVVKVTKHIIIILNNTHMHLFHQAAL